MRIRARLLAFAGLAVCLCAAPAFAAGSDGINREAGTATAQFLKIPVGARYVALGGAYAAIGNDAHGLYGQPAAGSMAAAHQIGGTHNEWLSDVRHEYLGFIYKLDEGRAVTGHFTSLGTGDLERTDEDAAGNYVATGGTFDATDYAVAIGYADNLTPALNYGVTVKYLNSEIDNVSGNAFALDAGAVYHVTREFSVGASLTNLGSKMKFISTGNRLPLTWRFGAAYDYPVHPLFGVLLTGDAVKPIDARWAGHFGLELHGDPWALRAGYRTGDALDNGFSCGAGFTFFEALTVDYAWAPAGDLGNTQFFTATYQFK